MRIAITVLHLIGSPIVARKLALSVGLCVLLDVGVEDHAVPRAGHELLVVRAWQELRTEDIGSVPRTNCRQNLKHTEKIK